MKENIKIDEIVDHLIIDGEKPKDTIMVYGFIGEGSDDTTMLYLDPVLQTSVEVKDVDILYSVSVTRTHTSLGGTIVWIQNASSYLHKNTVQSQQEAAQFFQGDIYQEYLTASQQNNNAQSPGCSCK